MRILVATLLALALPSTALAAVDAVPGELLVKPKDGPMKVRHVALKTNVRHASKQLERDPSIEWAQPNYYQHGAGLPNDELYGKQWSLPVIGAPAAWDQTTGSASVPVAIVEKLLILAFELVVEHHTLDANVVFVKPFRRSHVCGVKLRVVRQFAGPRVP